MKIILFALLLLPYVILAGPFVEVEEDEVVQGDVFIQSSMMDFLAKDAVCKVEGNNSDCLPVGVNNVPTELVNCVVGECVCKKCFMKNSDGKCYLCPSFKYSEEQGVCGADNRPTQLTALLLSIFVSFVGAANYYIEQYTLAIVQLVLFVVLLIICYLYCCLPCIWRSKEAVAGSLVFKCIMIPITILQFLIGLVIWAWWIADLVIFALNRRPSGSGCVLTPIQ